MIITCLNLFFHRIYQKYFLKKVLCLRASRVCIQCFDLLFLSLTSLPDGEPLQPGSSCCLDLQCLWEFWYPGEMKNTSLPIHTHTHDLSTLSPIWSLKHNSLLCWWRPLPCLTPLSPAQWVSPSRALCRVPYPPGFPCRPRCSWCSAAGSTASSACCSCS